MILIALWAAWVGREYLNFDPTIWPAGRELGLVIRTHYIWTLLPRCGDCILWNGFFNGGGPAFAELARRGVTSVRHRNDVAVWPC